MNKEIESQLKRIKPVIEKVDSYTQEQMIEFAKFVSGYTAEYVSQEIEEACWEMEGHMLGIFYSAENAIKELFEDDDEKEFSDSHPKLTLEDFLGKDGI
ncbi:hypothetical protein LaPh949_gp119 [Lactococcus phage 949]|uniref:Uncharacterized protein n=1 Tax=Lactococcus phage 949 TaxID=881953 RepID=E0YJ06_9CAUD|nr:hypothetical protein LaPh949_gp119 [Lactococcus phage 949]ADM73677.1 hypothetical protein [Lactococcus phage 949]